MTAHITFGVNPQHGDKSKRSLHCCIPYCNNVVGEHVYYYDRGHKHYTGVCDTCIAYLREHAPKDGYIVKEARSNYHPGSGSASTTITIFTRRNHGGQTCTKCGAEMTEFTYSCHSPIVQCQNMCFRCAEKIKYDARVSNHLILSDVDLRVGGLQHSQKSNTPSIQEHSTSWPVVCSKCFSHTFRYKQWSRGNLTGLCESCASTTNG